MTTKQNSIKAKQKLQNFHITAKKTEQQVVISCKFDKSKRSVFPLDYNDGSIDFDNAVGFFARFVRHYHINDKKEVKGIADSVSLKTAINKCISTNKDAYQTMLNAYKPIEQNAEN